MPKGIYDRSKAKQDRALFARNGLVPALKRGEGHYFWTKPEAQKIAAKWIELRLADPLETATILLEQAQRVLDGDRQRDLPSFKSTKQIVDEVARQWSAYLERTKTATPQPPAEPPAPPEPEVHVVTIEVPRKLTFDEMLAKMDESSLAALLTAKQITRQIRHDELLYAVAVQGGATGLPKVPVYIPKLDSFEPAKTHGPRIAIVGNSAGHRAILETEVKTHALDCILRFPDPNDATAMGRCDYAIICRGNSPGAATNSNGDKIIGQLGRSQVILLDSPTTENIMQEIRNLLSRK